jgi:hypothetical protein
LSESCPKIGDIPKSPFAAVAAMVPSAGTITLQIELRSHAGAVGIRIHDKFHALPDAEAKQVALSKVESWKRRDELPKELVTLPGESYPSSALADACSTLLLAPKSAALK